MLTDQQLINRLTQAQVKHLLHQDAQQWVLFEDQEYLWLTLDTVVQSIMAKAEPAQLMFNYHRQLIEHLPANFNSIIELGLGGGSLIRYLMQRHPQLNYTCVELSTIALDWFSQYFNPTQHPVTLIHGDAATELAQLPQADVLLCDLFSDFGSPACLFKTAFYQLCHRKFSQTMIINLLPRTPDEITQVVSLCQQAGLQPSRIIKLENMRNHLIIINKKTSE
ncbi:spermidine synthase [Motilimonas sp. KMU-193]|uniref:spermidine synthase n=1 Tax=Motilimonas sp. KMU-193 TaxID=3388668 RepID=UPI00396B27FD